MKEESLLTLISEAREMLLDRSEQERNLIYYICKMNDEERVAIVMAYRMLTYDEEI